MSKNKNRTGSNSNSSGGEGDDDARKKRGNSQDERETSKKVRSAEHERKNNNEKDAKGADGDASNNNGNGNGETIVEDNDNVADNSQTKDAGRSDDRSPKTSGHNTESRKSEDQAKQREQRDQVWDLESALLYLVQVGSTVDNNKSEKDQTEHQRKDNNNNNNIISNNPDTAGVVKDIGRERKTEEMEDRETTPKGNSKDGKVLAASDGGSSLVREYLTHEENSWITFRTAHAGDASTIAQWYRKQRSENRHNRRRWRNQGASTSNNGKENETAEEEVQREPEEPEIDKQPLRPSSSNEEDAGSERNRHNNKNNNNNINSSSSSNNNANNENNKDNDNDNDSNDAATDDEVDHEADGEEDKSLSSSLKLEHWLSEGLGDENTCPFVHGLLAYVHRSSKKGTWGTTNENDDNITRSPTVATLPPPTTVPPVHNNNNNNNNEEEEEEESNHSGHHLAAVVLMSLSWAFGKRNLRIEWMSIDSYIPRSKDEGLALRQKVWLRIHMLSAMTACQAISIDEDVLLSASEKEQASPSSPPSASKAHDEEEPLDGAGSNTKGASPKNHQAPVASSNQVEPSAE
jgi:hypothetical protein